MTGQGRIITYFARALRNEPYDPVDVIEGNLTPNMRLFSNDEEVHHLKGLKRPSQLHIQYPTPIPPRSAMPWVHYRISASNAVKVKSPTHAYSINDAITAFYTQSHTNARARAGVIPADEPITLERAASVRAQCGYSDRYLGSCVGAVSTFIMPHQDLSTTAAQLRKRLRRHRREIRTQLRDCTCPL